MTFIKNIKDAFAASSDEQDRGTLVETVLLVAGFAVVAILVVTWLGNAIAGSAADAANCISSSNTFSSSSAEANCKKTTNSDTAKGLNKTSIDNRFK
jgi:hypothetical protein